MEAIKDVGVISIFENDVNWSISNFYKLPQKCDTVIRSPHFRYRDGDWYMEVYPNGCKLHFSSGWFGISVTHLTSNSYLRIIDLAVESEVKRSRVSTQVVSYGDGFYCCTRLLPASLLKSWKDIFSPVENLNLFLRAAEEYNRTEAIAIEIRLPAEDVQKLCTENFGNVCMEASALAEEEKEVSLVTNVGVIFDDPDSIQWKICNFCDLLQECYSVIRSPHFHHKGSEWYVEIYPRGRNSSSSLGWFSISFRNLNSDPSLQYIAFSVVGEAWENWMMLFSKSLGDGFFSCTKILPTSLLKFWKDIISPGGSLHLIFVASYEGMNVTVNDVVIRLSKKNVRKMYKHTLENKDTFIEAYTETEGEIEALQQNFGSACAVKSTVDVKRIEALKQDFGSACVVKSTIDEKRNEIGIENQDSKDLFLNENVNDIVLKGQDKEFGAHKRVLASRSPVFSTVMMHDTKEKVTRIVDLQDVEQEIFPRFVIPIILLFLLFLFLFVFPICIQEAWKI